MTMDTVRSGGRRVGDDLSGDGLGWLVADGIFYTVGLTCYALDQRWPGGHGIWHLFVLAGSPSHYFVILLYL